VADDSTTTGSRERASRTAIAAMTQERERVMEGGIYVRKCQFKYFRKEVATFNLLAVIAMTTMG